METNNTAALEARLAFIKSERATLSWAGNEAIHEKLMLEEAKLTADLFWGAF